jgi:tetratricopeptide (TPR) repeat protein
MRQLRPENYSDTEERNSYILYAAVFDHYLDTLTAHNQSQDFEIFCRKVCERTICPNLRHHTGPDGGGDSKADTETFPISEEIALRAFVGQPNSGAEKWAFAFSAKKDWTAKARSDVKGLAETNRGYQRIIFVTSQYARDKLRADLEQKLTNEFGIAVTIHDRSWIIQEVIEHDRKDLAYNYLRIGQEVADPKRLGPADYSRSRQLGDIEKALSDPSSFDGMRIQEVTEALIAAKLSRSLERPRFETDGRFARAIRIADAYGTSRQKLEARYESLWTAVWWFDDIDHVNQEYDTFEALVIIDESAKNLEFLSNLLQMLANSVIYRDLTKDQCKLDERTHRLTTRLDELVTDASRPNNALEARTLRQLWHLNGLLLEGNHEAFSSVWRELEEILQEARGLGEYDAERLVKLIEIFGDAAGNDPAYNTLVEDVAAFATERTGEVAGALVLLRRAQKLDLEDKYDIIRLLGKAIRQLSKKECSEHLTQALQLQAVAYRGAGLLWAARANCISAVASIAIGGEADSQLDPVIIPTLGILAWISLELRHIPDFLKAIQLLNGFLRGLPLTEESSEHLQGRLLEFDAVFSSNLLNFSSDELGQLEKYPDIFEGLGLVMARSSLLYALGHKEVLCTEGSIPKEETDEEIEKLFSRVASQPASDDVRGPLITNSGGPQKIQVTVLGMTVDIAFDGTDTSILVAEAVAASVEACFATAFELKIHPHTERFTITILEDKNAETVSFDIDENQMAGKIAWPAGLSPLAYDREGGRTRGLAQIAFTTLAATCVLQAGMKVIDQLMENETVFDRISAIPAVGNSYNRVFGQHVSRMDAWDAAVRTTYRIREARPQIVRVQLPASDTGDDDADISDKKRRNWPKEAGHRDVEMKSVIDYHLWNRAGWRGAGYTMPMPNTPPGIALIFTNEAAARLIFQRWQDRFGRIDREEDIYLSIVRDISEKHPAHYSILISSKLANAEEGKVKTAMLMSRFHRMQATTDTHIRQFLAAVKDAGVYLLMPAVMEAGGTKFLFDLAILKRNLAVKSAKLLDQNDVEQCVTGTEANSHFERDDE